MPFTRTAEGVLDLRNFGGQKNKRTVFAGSTTGQQLLSQHIRQRRYPVRIEGGTILVQLSDG